LRGLAVGAVNTHIAAARLAMPPDHLRPRSQVDSSVSGSESRGDDFGSALYNGITMWRLRPSILMGALWASFAALVVRRELKRKGMRAHVPRPPRLGDQAGKGVAGALSRLSPTCLERALVLQTWLAAHGTMRDVVIGLPKDGMKSHPAHAWVDGTERLSSATYIELHRLPAPSTALPRGRPLGGWSK